MTTGTLVRKTIHAAAHPLETAGHAVGLVRGTAEAVLHAVSDLREPSTEPADEPAPPPGARLEQVPPAPEREPQEPHESFATEPTAVTRDSARGAARRGVAGDADLDEWYAEAEDEHDPIVESVIEALALGDRRAPVGHGELKAIRTESEILRRAAETDKG